MSAMAELVRLKREPLALLLTCPICHDLFSDPTTISECLHSFCRKCIYNKITEEEMDCCPVCKTHLGCNPLDKLRADNSLNNLRTKIFGAETEKLGRKIVGSKAGSSMPPPANPAKNLISPFKAEPSKPPPEPSKGSRKKRSMKKKNGAQQQLPRSITKGIVIVENAQNNVSPPPDLASKKVSLKGKEKVEDNDEISERKADPATKLLYSSIVASTKMTTKDNKEANNEQKDVAQAISLDGLSGGVLNLNLDENLHGLIGTSKLGAPNPKELEDKRPVVLGITAPPNVIENNAVPNVVKSSGFKIIERYQDKIWFWLTPSHNIRRGYQALPELLKPYLRAKSEATVLSVRTFLMEKFHLSGVDEVQVMMRGQPLDSTLTLVDLIEMWIRTSPVKLTTLAIPGSSAKDFIMVLCYSCKKKVHP